MKTFKADPFAYSPERFIAAWAKFSAGEAVPLPDACDGLADDTSPVFNDISHFSGLINSALGVVMPDTTARISNDMFGRLADHLNREELFLNLEERLEQNHMDLFKEPFRCDELSNGQSVAVLPHLARPAPGLFPGDIDDPLRTFQLYTRQMPYRCSTWKGIFIRIFSQSSFTPVYDCLLQFPFVDGLVEYICWIMGVVHFAWPASGDPRVDIFSRLEPRLTDIGRQRLHQYKSYAHTTRLPLSFGELLSTRAWYGSRDLQTVRL